MKRSMALLYCLGQALRLCSGQAFGSFDPPEKRDVCVELKPLARSIIASIYLGFMFHMEVSILQF